MQDLLNNLKERKEFTKMNENYFIQLSKIFNTLKLVHTKGEDTLLMCDCLRALDSMLIELKENDLK
jgi:hypothetical protein